MHRIQSGAALVVALTLQSAQAAPPTGTCHLVVIPDYSLVVAYRAVLRPSPTCAADVTIRVRKSSSISRKRNGDPYQPIRPLVGAWNVGVYGTTVPDKELWTSTVTGWRWQWFDPAANRWRDAQRPS